MRKERSWYKATHRCFMSLRTWKAEARHEKFKAASVTSWATWEHLLKWQKEGTKEQERKKERKKTEMWKARQKKEQKKRKWLPFVLTGNSRETGRCLHSCGLYTQPLLISVHTLPFLGSQSWLHLLHPWTAFQLRWFSICQSSLLHFSFPNYVS